MKTFKITPQSSRLIGREELCNILSIPEALLEYYIGMDFFPEPYLLGDSSIRWRSDEIEEAIESLPHRNGELSISENLEVFSIDNV